MIEVLTTIKDFLWDYVLLFALIGIGIYMSIRLRFPQVTRLFPSIGKLIRDIKNKVPAQEGRMTPFQSLATAIAAQVGTGNIVGVATAIASGGPGAAFWMMLSAFFGMSTIFSEAVLAQFYRQEKDGQYVGGPAYYIRKGMKSKWLSVLFAIFTIIALGIVGLMVQSNAIVTSLSESFKLSGTWITIGLTAIVGVILTGGMQRIAVFSERVVPVMAFAYILGSVIIIFMNLGMFLPALKMIFVGAFTPQAIGGGVLGITIQRAIQLGLARGLFSNEAGMGSTPHSHAVASTDHPAEQGFIAMIGVFVSTFMICLATVMVNLTSGSYDPTIPAAEAAKGATLMTQRGFASGFGSFGGTFLSISLASFALTTIIGWYFFAESNVIMLAGEKKSIIGMFRIIALGFLVVGTLLDGEIIWMLADLFTGLMALPNIVALLFLSGIAKKLLDHYDKCKKENQLKWPAEEDLK
ncbi:MAG TPA: alanine:cation symporter family protein [Clostridiaceae bacterium]|nr:alanine:cation symporter family protein [Clostridiaceae bacterium]